MAALASGIGMKGASSYQRYEEKTNYFKREYLRFDLAMKIGRVLEGNGTPPVQYSDVMDLAGVERALDGSRPVAADDASHRTRQQIFEHHVIASQSGDLYAVMADFDEKSVVVTLENTYRGRQEIGDFFTDWIETFSGVEWKTKSAFEDQVALVKRTAKMPNGSSVDVVESILFRNGLIHVLTVTMD